MARLLQVEIHLEKRAERTKEGGKIPPLKQRCLELKKYINIYLYCCNKITDEEKRLQEQHFFDTMDGFYFQYCNAI